VKSLFIITGILATTVTLGVWQNSKLRQINRETTLLEVRLSVAPRHDRLRESFVAPPSVSADEQDTFFEMFVTAMVGFYNSPEIAAADDQRRTMLTIAAKFSADDMDRLLQRLRQDPRFAAIGNESEIVHQCLSIFSKTAPISAMKFLESHRDLADWDSRYVGCFFSYLRTHPADALRWFDEKKVIGDPNLTTPWVHQFVLIREARIDPDNMLARATTPEFSSDPETISHLGGRVASSLTTPSEHREFLAALRRKQNTSEPSPLLSKIREEYISGLSHELVEFSFEDSSAIMDSEFSLDERLGLVSGLSHRGDLDAPAKWATWLMKIDPAEWEAWKTAKGTKDRHPAPQFCQIGRNATIRRPATGWRPSPIPASRPT
jgi:hypothetical protein